MSGPRRLFFQILLIASLSTLFFFLVACGDADDSAEGGTDDEDDSANNDDAGNDDDNATTDDDDDDDDDSAVDPQGTLLVKPDHALVEIEASTLFEAYVEDEQGRQHRVDPVWSVLPDAGVIDQLGNFTASGNIGAFSNAVSAEYRGQAAYADVTVTTPRADFKWGFSHAVQPESIYVWSGATYEEKLDRMVADFQTVGASWYRAYIIWRDVDAVLEDPELELGDITDDLVEAYAFEDADKDWSKYDTLIDKTDAAGIRLFLVIAAGYTWELPRVDDGLDGLVAALPETIGTDNYVAQACLHARAAVRRYGSSVGVWVTEAELNMAGPTVLWGWRDGQAWWDWNFLTDLLATLSDCVHQEDADAQVTMNFHTDIAWKSHVRQWAPYLDIISLDAFPNYFISDPVRGRVVGRRVGEALALGTGKPVVIQETSYPTDLSYLNFTEAKQALFIQDAARSVFEAGGSGYFHFKLSAAEELGGGPWYQEAESRYGLVRTDDTYKPGFFAYQEIIEELAGQDQ